MAVIRNNGRKCLNNSAWIHHLKKVTSAAGVLPAKREKATPAVGISFIIEEKILNLSGFYYKNITNKYSNFPIIG